MLQSCGRCDQCIDTHIDSCILVSLSLGFALLHYKSKRLQGSRQGKESCRGTMPVSLLRRTYWCRKSLMVGYIEPGVRSWLHQAHVCQTRRTRHKKMYNGMDGRAGQGRKRAGQGHTLAYWRVSEGPLGVPWGSASGCSGWRSSQRPSDASAAPSPACCACASAPGCPLHLQASCCCRRSAAVGVSGAAHMSDAAHMSAAAGVFSGRNAAVGVSGCCTHECCCRHDADAGNVSGICNWWGRRMSARLLAQALEDIRWGCGSSQDFRLRYGHLLGFHAFAYGGGRACAAQKHQSRLRCLVK